MKFFIVTYVRKPNGLVDEQIQVASRVRPKDIAMSNIILDFSTKKIVKCVVDRQTLDTDWERVYSHFAGLYPAIIDKLEKSQNTNLLE